MTEARTLVAAFRVDGEPVSKSRARFTRRGYKNHAYTPERTKTAERMVMAAFRAAAPGHEPDDTHQYAIEAQFLCGTFHRRDVDNMLKLICDGLNGIAWADDSQVTEISGRKTFTSGDFPAGTLVNVWRLGPIGFPSRDCAHCGQPFRTYPSLSKQRFCSQQCSSASRAIPRQRECAQCGRAFDGGKPGRTAVYCSRECQSAAGRVALTCDGCGAGFTKQRCHVKARNYCGTNCQASAARERRAKAAKGTCAACGGTTSKKSYMHCRACDFALKGKGATGKPQPIKETEQ